MNITKEEALKKIEELKKFVENIEDEEKYNFELGDIFIYEQEKLVILSAGFNSNKFMVCRLDQNNYCNFYPFADDLRNKEEMRQYLRINKYKKIGKIIPQYF